MVGTGEEKRDRVIGVLGDDSGGEDPGSLPGASGFFGPFLFIDGLEVLVLEETEDLLFSTRDGGTIGVIDLCFVAFALTGAIGATDVTVRAINKLYTIVNFEVSLTNLEVFQCNGETLIPVGEVQTLKILNY